MKEKKTKTPGTNVKKENEKGKKFNKKLIIFTIITIFTTCLLVGLIIFFVNKIPSKYYGTYVRYYYFNGNESKITYKISPLSVKSISERTVDGKNKINTESYRYTKKENDLIIKNKNGKLKNYLIIDNDCLYIESSKDISTSKKYGLFYWNIKSDKADIYEIENKSESIEDLIEKTMNTWSRKLIYDTANRELNDYEFYILNSDEKTDDTDLNTYEVVYNAAGGKLSLYYDRKTKNLERIYFSGSILASSITGTDTDSMSVEDIYDAKAMLMSCMYILGNKKNIELNIDTENSKDYSKALTDLNYRSKVAGEFDDLLSNKTVDEKYNDRYTYSLSNSKYSIEFTNWISSNTYSVTGVVSFNISIK